jgi:uncharacterized iron-regulated membrane protein
LNSLVDERRLPVEAFVCEGLWHRTKEEKYPNPVVGFLAKQAMLLTAVSGYLVFWLRRRVLTRVRRSRWTRRRLSAGARSQHP